MSSDSTHSDHHSSIKPVLSKSVSHRTRSRVMILNTNEPQNILMKPLSVNNPADTLSLINLGDDWSDSEEVSKPDQESFPEPDFNTEISVEKELYKQEIVPFCEKMDSIMTSARLAKLYEECPHPTCSIVIPEPGERAHQFKTKTPDRGIPNAVTSAAFFKVGVYFPLHPFLREVLEFYGLAPFQLTPNSYRLAISTYILYSSLFTTPLSAPELGYFFRLKDTGKGSGCFYLTAWPGHQGQCVKSVKQNFDQWQEQFLYCFDCPSVRFEFNCRPLIPKQTVLSGSCLIRAEEALKHSSSLKDCMTLLTPENLTALGFIPASPGNTPLFAMLYFFILSSCLHLPSLHLLF